MPFTLRELHDFDSMRARFPLIQQLNPKMTEERYERLLRAILKQGGYFQIGCFNEQGACVAVSGVWIGTQIWCGKFIEIDNFVVDENHRRHGIGKILVDWIEARGHQEGCEMIRLDSYVTQEKAHAFYFAQGFEILGHHMVKRLA